MKICKKKETVPFESDSFCSSVRASFFISFRANLDFSWTSVQRIHRLVIGQTIVSGSGTEFQQRSELTVLEQRPSGQNSASIASAPLKARSRSVVAGSVVPSWVVPCNYHAACSHKAGRVLSAATGRTQLLSSVKPRFSLARSSMCRQKVVLFALGSPQRLSPRLTCTCSHEN